MRQVLIMALALASATPAFAADAPCPALPAELTGWDAKTPVAAPGQLAIGKAADLKLLPTPQVRYAAAPEKPGAPASFGGVAGFSVAESGTYRVTLGAGVWVDVVKNGKAVASTAHAHGAACSGVRKMVDFTLSPGRYVLQIAGASAASVAVMIARRP